MKKPPWQGPMDAKGGVQQENKRPGADANYVQESLAFVDCLINNKPSPCSGEDGLIALIMSIAAGKSAEEGRWVKFTEIAQTVVCDADAELMREAVAARAEVVERKLDAHARRLAATERDGTVVPDVQLADVVLVVALLHVEAAAARHARRLVRLHPRGLLR